MGWVEGGEGSEVGVGLSSGVTERAVSLGRAVCASSWGGGEAQLSNAGHTPFPHALNTPTKDGIPGGTNLNWRAEAVVRELERSQRLAAGLEDGECSLEHPGE